ncbi:RGPA1-like protein [Mya arenaria]|uniref:RGPA1-like protein n=1 Tax=Mya arenaria TaxID=6604 RepID=A0ABY7F877_MYAAR|nr:RGPA1-like protein [Mya arenaria]
MDQTTVIDSDETSPLIKYEIDGGQNKPEVPDLQVPEWKTSSVAFQTSSPEQLRVTRRILGFTFLLVIALPETYTNEIRSKRTYTSRLENIKDSYSLFVSKENTGKRWMYIITLAVFSLTTYDVFGRVTVEGLYLLNYPFCWDPSELGAFTALRSGCQQIIGMAMIKVLHLCLNDELIAVVGCLSYGASFVLEGFATNDLMMYLVAVIGVWGLLTAPMIRSIMSQMTSPHKQGAVYGAIAAAETAVNLLSAVSSQTVYIATVEVMRGFIFLVYAAFNVISLVLMILMSSALAKFRKSNKDGDLKKAAQKVVDPKKDTLTRLKHLRTVLDNYEPVEAKKFFEESYSHIYYIFFDNFVSVESDLKQRANKSHREELDHILQIFEKILLLLPELVHKRWMFHSIGRIMKKLLHPGNGLRLRREGMRLFLVWYQILQDNASDECHQIFLQLVPGMGEGTHQDILYGRNAATPDSYGGIIAAGEITPILAVPGEKQPDNITKFFFEAFLQFIVSEII